MRLSKWSRLERQVIFIKRSESKKIKKEREREGIIGVHDSSSYLVLVLLGRPVLAGKNALTVLVQFQLDDLNLSKIG